jgi:hypothetical protein
MPLFQTAQGANKNRLPSLCYACMANSSVEQRFTTSATFNRDPVTCRYAKILPTNPGARKRTVLNTHWILARVNVCQSSSALGSFVRGHVACPKSIDASVSSASFILLYSFSYFFHTGRASRTFMPKHRDSLRAIGAITGITAAVKPQFNSHEQCFPDEQVSEPCVLLVASLSHARNKNLNLLAALPLSTAIYLCSLSSFFFLKKIHLPVLWKTIAQHGLFLNCFECIWPAMRIQCKETEKIPWTKISHDSG